MSHLSQPNLQLADLLVTYLEQLGVEYVFVVPGGPIESLYNALARSERRGGPRAVVARHETGAAFMADGYARNSGKIGVCCGMVGPGTTNLITGVASAYDNHTPLLVITAQTSLANFGKGATHESADTGINTVAMFSHCTHYFSLLNFGVLTNVSDTPFVFLPEKHRDNKYSFVQDVWSFANDWELTAGIRYDAYNDFGDTWNPRLALVWSARHDTTLKLLYVLAFRAPSFAEFRNQNNPVALGNDELDPEEIETFEFALDYRPAESLHLGANVFYYKWDDIIRFTASREYVNCAKC